MKRQYTAAAMWEAYHLGKNDGWAVDMLELLKKRKGWS